MADHDDDGFTELQLPSQSPGVSPAASCWHVGEKEIHFVHKPLTKSMQLDNAIMLGNFEESFRNHIESEGKRDSNLVCVASHNNKMGSE